MVNRPVGIVTMEVVVLVPAPALRRAVVVVAVVTGCVRVEVTSRGRPVVGRVRVNVTGRVWVVAGAEPVPATGGNVNAFKASSTLTG